MGKLIWYALPDETESDLIALPHETESDGVTLYHRATELGGILSRSSPTSTVTVVPAGIAVDVLVSATEAPAKSPGGNDAKGRLVVLGEVPFVEFALVLTRNRIAADPLRSITERDRYRISGIFVTTLVPGWIALVPDLIAPRL